MKQLNPQILARRESEYNQAWAASVKHFERDLDGNNHELGVAISILMQIGMHRAALYLVCISLKLNLAVMLNEIERQCTD